MKTKPNIRKSQTGGWVCYNVAYWWYPAGWGDTPAAAYAEWQRKLP